MGNALQKLSWRYDMPSLEGYRKIEKIDGVIYNMSPSASIGHGIVNGNIFHAVRGQIAKSRCKVFAENLDFYLGDDEWLIPDIILVCDVHNVKNGKYSGRPRFVVEILSPSTAMRDKSIKKRKYESAGVEELWLIEPKGKSIEIYYLQDGKYELKDAYILDDDESSEDYNADLILKLRGMPMVSMTLGEIFEDSDWGSQSK